MIAFFEHLSGSIIFFLKKLSVTDKAIYIFVAKAELLLKNIYQ
jgi:hypothetical protein